jgi:hypothetical protein
MYIYLQGNLVKIFGMLLAEENIYRKNCNFKSWSFVHLESTKLSPKIYPSRCNLAFSFWFSSTVYNSITYFCSQKPEVKIFGMLHTEENICENCNLNLSWNSDDLKFTTNSSTNCPSRCNLACFLVFFGSLQWSSFINYRLP